MVHGSGAPFSASQNARLALLPEGGQRLLAVVAEPAPDHVAGLEVEAASSVCVAAAWMLSLMQRQASVGPCASLQREGVGRRVELGVGQHAVHEAQRQRLRCADALGEHVDLLRARRADQPREEPAAAVVARRADLREAADEKRVVRGEAEVAGERQREAQAGGRAAQLGDRRLAHVVQQLGGAARDASGGRRAPRPPSTLRCGRTRPRWRRPGPARPSSGRRRRCRTQPPSPASTTTLTPGCRAASCTRRSSSACAAVSRAFFTSGRAKVRVSTPVLGELPADRVVGHSARLRSASLFSEYCSII